MTHKIFSTDTDSGTISVVHMDGPDTLTLVAKIPVGNAPRGGVKFTKDGRGFVSNCAGDTISEIDAITNREIARIKVGIAPRGIGILPNERFALVSNSGSNTVSVVDLATRIEIHQIAVGRDPRHMAITKNGEYAYISIWGSDHIAKIDIRGLNQNPPVLETIKERSRLQVPIGSHPYSVAIAASRNLLFVANTQSNLLSVFSTVDDSLVQEIDLKSKGARAIAFDADCNTAFVSVEDISAVAAIDLQTLTVVRSIPVGPGPRGLAVTSNPPVIICSAFSRESPNRTPDHSPRLVASASATFSPNSLTFVDLSATRTMALSNAELPWNEIQVGKGPCSVSVFKVESAGRGSNKS